MKASQIDPVWEQQIYSQGQHLNRYPFDCVVTFVMRHRPRDKSRADTQILEIGSGAGNNMWFAAREGFQVAGLEGSQSALNFARERFAREGLAGDFQLGDFAALPWDEASFDLVVDRGSLTCVGADAQRAAVAEVRRVLRPGGCFLYNGYSDAHTSASSGVRQPDGRTTDIRAGTLRGVGGIFFSPPAHVKGLFREGWKVLKSEHLSIADDASGQPEIHAEWRVVACKR